MSNFLKIASLTLACIVFSLCACASLSNQEQTHPALSDVITKIMRGNIPSQWDVLEGIIPSSISLKTKEQPWNTYNSQAFATKEGFNVTTVEIRGSAPEKNGEIVFIGISISPTTCYSLSKAKADFGLAEPFLNPWAQGNTPKYGFQKKTTWGAIIFAANEQSSDCVTSITTHRHAPGPSSDSITNIEMAISQR